jgi:1-deoxy-D-xylulose-5-phosphate reductoisomerase
MKKIAILGATGSIGTQTLDVISQYPDCFELYAITGNDNWQLLAQQARQYKPEVVCVANESNYIPLKEALSDMPVKVYAGMDSIAQMVQMSTIDVVVTAIRSDYRVYIMLVID